MHHALYYMCVYLHSKCDLPVCSPGDAVWHVGGGPTGLAEEHGLSPLHPQQQADHLVLAGRAVCVLPGLTCYSLANSSLPVSHSANHRLSAPG